VKSFSPETQERRMTNLLRSAADRATRYLADLCWAAATVWQGRTAMRISVSSWATSDDDVERSLAAIMAAAGEPAPA